jgi:uncharacterized membrane protein YhaH (DUF805 family)
MGVVPLNWRFWFSFHGRMRRREWWLSRLVSWGAFVVMLLLAGGFAIIAGGGDSDAATMAMFTAPAVALFPLIAWFDIATSVKRLHDTGITGWAYLMVFIPFVGGLLSLIVMGCLDGTMGPNKFGPSPKFPDVTATGMIFE